METKTNNELKEKHIPKVSKNNNEITIKVGNILHEMNDNHYIKNIYLRTTNKIYKKKLTPNDRPETTFILENNEKPISAYCLCNLHSLWINIIKNEQI